MVRQVNIKEAAVAASFPGHLPGSGSCRTDVFQVREPISMIFNTILPKSFYSQKTEAVATQLLGKVLVHDESEARTVGMIVETEAYITGDLANHASRGQTLRNAVMFGPPGIVYLYKIYGMYWCMNIVTGKADIGEAVLIRAIEPIEGISLMHTRRNGKSIEQLANGPGKLTQAMHITYNYNGWDIMHPPLMITEGVTIPGENITATTRIGITKDLHRQLRYYIAGSPYVSRP